LVSGKLATADLLATTTHYQEKRMFKRYPSNWSMVALLAVFALLLAACGGSAPEPTPVPLQSYSDPTFGFALDYPVTWVQGNSEDGMVEFKSSADVAFDLEYDGGSLIQAITIPTLFLDSADPVEVLGMFTEDMLAGMRAEDENAQVTQEATAAQVNGMPAAKMVAEAQQGTVQARAEVYVVVEGETAALIMAVYPVSDASTYESLVSRVINTFSFIAE
jgi:hypothetical protein